MIAHKVTFYSGNGKRSSLGQSVPMSLPPKPANADQAVNGGAANTFFIFGSLLALTVLAITVVANSSSRD